MLILILFYLFLSIYQNLAFAAPLIHEKLTLSLAIPKHSAQFDTEFQALLKDFQRIHPQMDIQIKKKRNEYSTLKELMVSQATDKLPDLAVVLPSDISTLTHQANLKLVDLPSFQEIRKKLHPTYKKQSSSSLPFLRTGLAIFVDQELLFRAHLDPHQKPKDVPSILSLAKQMKKKLQLKHPLSLPLDGNSGLWIFESLFEIPLWNSGRVNRRLKKGIEYLHQIFDIEQISKRNTPLEEGIEKFLQRKSPLLVAPMNIIHELTSKAPFRFTAYSISKTGWGSHLIALRKNKAADLLVRYLYSSAAIERWQLYSGYYPVVQDKYSKKLEKKIKFLQVLTSAEPCSTLPSGGIQEVSQFGKDLVRLRSIWIQSLSRLLALPSIPSPATVFFDDLDRELKHSY